LKQEDQWYVALKAEKPPAIGDWVEINEHHAAVLIAFLDGTEAEGFTNFEDSAVREGPPLWSEVEERHARGDIPWLNFSDCMEIVGVQRLKSSPDGWMGNDTFWLLTVESLPSNLEFERRYSEEADRRRKMRPMIEKIKEWWGLR